MRGTPWKLTYTRDRGALQGFREPPNPGYGDPSPCETRPRLHSPTMKISKRELVRRQREVQRLAMGERFIHERLSSLYDELGMLLPRPQRRRTNRKAFVDRVGNLVRFPRGQQP
jgi:hypothetical protein